MPGIFHYGTACLSAEDEGDAGWWGLCRGAWVTDRRQQRELGSQHATGMGRQQAAVIRIISHTAAGPSARRQILIGKIS